MLAYSLQFFCQKKLHNILAHYSYRYIFRRYFGFLEDFQPNVFNGLKLPTLNKSVETVLQNIGNKLIQRRMVSDKSLNEKVVE